MRRSNFLEKMIMLKKVKGKRRRKPTVMWVDSVKVPVGVPLEDLKAGLFFS